MNGRIKAGLIGCGNIGLRHAQALSHIEDLYVVGVADPTPERRRKMQELLALPEAACHADYHDLLAQRPDYVVVATPQHIRRQIIEDCARAGVHVLTEKPIATTPSDAQAMIKAMRAANLRYGIMHNYLFIPQYELARRLIAEGAIGQLRHVTLNFLGVPDRPGAAEYQPRWRHDPAAAGGGILMDMIHAVYLAEFLVGGPIRAVSAVVDNLDHPGDLVEDFTLVNYQFDSGYATINMWWGDGPGGVEISGTQGRIMVFYEHYSTLPFTKLESFMLVNAEGRQAYDVHGNDAIESFTRMHKDFSTAIRTGSDPVAPAEAGLRALQATLAAYASGATGRLITLPLDQEHPVFQHGVGGLREMDVRKDGPLVKHGVFGLR